MYSTVYVVELGYTVQFGRYNIEEEVKLSKPIRTEGVGETPNGESISLSQCVLLVYTSLLESQKR